MIQCRRDECIANADQVTLKNLKHVINSTVQEVNPRYDKTLGR